jgi:hypothetical protein
MFPLCAWIILLTVLVRCIIWPDSIHLTEIAVVLIFGFGIVEDAIERGFKSLKNRE